MLNKFSHIIAVVAPLLSAALLVPFPRPYPHICSLSQSASNNNDNNNRQLPHSCLRCAAGVAAGVAVAAAAADVECLMLNVDGVSLVRKLVGRASKIPNENNTK